MTLSLSPPLWKKIIIASILEFGPIAVFLFSFEQFQIYKATFSLIIATIVSTVLTYRIQKRLPYFALYIAFITTIFGYLTLYGQNPKFIQMRDTLYDVTCALTLIFGLIYNISFLKIAFHEVIPMTVRAWDKVTHMWIIFFITIAILNEYIRRSFSLDVWFSFKSIVVIVTIVFGICTLYFFYEKENK